MKPTTLARAPPQWDCGHLLLLEHIYRRTRQIVPVAWITLEGGLHATQESLANRCFSDILCDVGCDSGRRHCEIDVCIGILSPANVSEERDGFGYGVCLDVHSAHKKAHLTNNFQSNEASHCSISHLVFFSVSDVCRPLFCADRGCERASSDRIILHYTIGRIIPE